MKKIILSTLLSLSSLLAFDININITEVEGVKGKIYIGLYNTKVGFREVSKTFKKEILDITSKPVSYSFKGVPSGTYAISIFHDKNVNGKLDTNLFGVPTEGYGFSKNIRHLLSATEFEEASFVLKEDTNLTINMGY